MLQGLNLKQEPGGYLVWQLLNLEMPNHGEVQKVLKERPRAVRGSGDTWRDSGVATIFHIVQKFCFVSFFKYFGAWYANTVAYRLNVSLVSGGKAGGRPHTAS